MPAFNRPKKMLKTCAHTHISTHHHPVSASVLYLNLKVANVAASARMPFNFCSC